MEFGSPERGFSTNSTARVVRLVRGSDIMESKQPSRCVSGGEILSGIGITGSTGAFLQPGRLQGTFDPGVVSGSEI